MVANIVQPKEQEKTYRCPCRGYKTLRGPGQDDHNASDDRGEPNYELSLTKARENCKEFKTKRPSCATVRPPPYEI
jgi:hypothetical protein